MKTGEAILVVGGLTIGAYLLYRSFNPGVVSPVATPVKAPVAANGWRGVGANNSASAGSIAAQSLTFAASAAVNPVGTAAGTLVTGLTQFSKPGIPTATGKVLLYPVQTVTNGVVKGATAVTHFIGGLF
jgi:hypothetical protein